MKVWVVSLLISSLDFPVLLFYFFSILVTWNYFPFYIVEFQLRTLIMSMSICCRFLLVNVWVQEGGTIKEIWSTITITAFRKWKYWIMVISNMVSIQGALADIFLRGTDFLTDAQGMASLVYVHFYQFLFPLVRIFLN